MADNTELKEFAEQTRAGATPGAGSGRPKKQTPAQLREQATAAQAKLEQAKIEAFTNTARSHVRLLEEKLKPGAAGYLLGPEAKVFFTTPPDKYQILIEPLAEFYRLTDFHPENPYYYLGLFFIMWGFITYDQYQALVEAAIQKQEHVETRSAPEAKPGWFQRETAKTESL